MIAVEEGIRTEFTPPLATMQKRCLKEKIQSKPSGSDAFIAALFCGILNDYFGDPFHEYFAEKENLVQYTKEMMQLFYPAYQPNF